MSTHAGEFVILTPDMRAQVEEVARLWHDTISGRPREQAAKIAELEAEIACLRQAAPTPELPCPTCGQPRCPGHAEAGGGL